jgi:hypothetical protein
MVRDQRALYGTPEHGVDSPDRVHPPIIPAAPASHPQDA